MDRRGDFGSFPVGQMNCLYCGLWIPPGADRCGHCGARLTMVTRNMGVLFIIPVLLWFGGCAACMYAKPMYAKPVNPWDGQWEPLFGLLGGGLSLVAAAVIEKIVGQKPEWKPKEFFDPPQGGRRRD